MGPFQETPKCLPKDPPCTYASLVFIMSGLCTLFVLDWVAFQQVVSAQKQAPHRRCCCLLVFPAVHFGPLFGFLLKREAKGNPTSFVGPTVSEHIETHSTSTAIAMTRCLARVLLSPASQRCLDSFCGSSWLQKKVITPPVH